MELNVCMLGGGTRLAAHLGSLKGIDEHGGRIRGWAGASAGSLVASVLASGFSHDAAVDLMRDTDYRQFLDFRPLGIVRGYGLCAGRRFEQWLDNFLEGRRFCDLQHPLSVVCTDIQTGEPFIFSNQTTPEIKVATSVRCSIGIPGIFAVRRMQGAILIDGSLAAIDDELLFPDSPHETVTIRLVRNQVARLARSKQFGLKTYVQRVAGMLLDAADEPSISGDQWRRTLLVRTGAHSSVNFDLSVQERAELYAMGYEQSRNFLDLSGSEVRKKSAAPPAATKDYRDLEELAEDAVRLACDTSRTVRLPTVDGPLPAPEKKREQIPHNPYTTMTGFGFDAL